MPPFVETIIRSLLIIFGLFFITKILGKKQLSQLSFFEYIAGITVGDIAGTLSMDARLSIGDGVTSLLIWALFPIVISYLSLKSKKFRDFVEGKPTTFIEGGKILEGNLRKEKYSTDELLEQLRKKNVFRVADVEFASLDTNGELSILLKKSRQPLTVSDINKEIVESGAPKAVILDGVIYDDALKKVGLNREWLIAELKQYQVSPEDLFLAQVDKQGNLTFDKYKDFETGNSTNNDKLLMLLMKARLELEENALTVSAPYLKRFYATSANTMEMIMNNVQPYLESNEDNLK